MTRDQEPRDAGPVFDPSGRAADLVREAYEGVGAMRAVRLRSINEPRPPELRYRSRAVLLRDFLAIARGVAAFAVEMSLLAESERRRIVEDFQAAHPDLGADAAGPGVPAVPGVVPPPPDDLPADRHGRALALVRWHYRVAVALAGADLARVNRERPARLRYRDRDELLREALAVAGWVATFAVRTGLIHGMEHARAIREFQDAHPELPRVGEPRPDADQARAPPPGMSPEV